MIFYNLGRYRSRLATGSCWRAKQIDEDRLEGRSVQSDVEFTTQEAGRRVGGLPVMICPWTNKAV